MTPRPTRRQVLAAGAGTVGALLAAAPSRASDASSSLRSAAASGGWVFGSAGGPELLTDRAYRELFIDECAMLVPQNALKFDALQPRHGVFRFAEADALVDGARANGLMARGTALFWNDWPPAWLKTLSKPELARVFDAYIDAVVPHFAGRLQSWDVVNEPFWLGSDKPGTFRPGAWLSAFGPEYIPRAFQRVAALDPYAKLVLNEAWTERSDPVGLAVRKALLRLIDEMRDKGLKLDAIGLQGHLTPQFPYDDAGFADFLHEIAARDVEIYITEFDVSDAIYPEDPTERDAAVAKRAHAFLDAVLPVPAVTTIITWGLSDRYSWWRDPATMAAYGLTRLPRPLPYDDDLERKPMADAMAIAFQKHRLPRTTEGATSAGLHRP